MNLFKNPVISRPFTLIFGDIVLSVLSFYVGFLIRFYHGNILQSAKSYNPILPKVVVFSMFVVFISFLMDLYGFDKGKGKKKLFLKVLFSGVLIFTSLAAFYYFVPSVQLGRGILFIAISLFIVSQALWHFMYDFGLKGITPVAQNVLILGTGRLAKVIGRLFNVSENNIALAGYVNLINEPVHVPQSYIIEHSNGGNNGSKLLDIALKEKVDTIVISLAERRGTLPVKDILNCKLNGIDIVDAPSFYEQISGKLLLENITPSWFIFSDGFQVTIYRKYFKRLFDITIAIIGICLSLPLLIIIPILIKLNSKGPVFFKQERVGEGERVFTLYKYRTMIDEAEKGTGPVWSKEKDPRITRVGRFLRRSRLDEIPQLFNVLCGDMSLIGPRPERSFFVESLKEQIPYYAERHCVKPGITGWAQVKYEYGDSIEDAIEKLRYDLYYIKHLSFPLDLLIIMDTIKVVLFGRGGR